MKSIFYFLIVSVILFSCSDEGGPNAFDGLYSGTFYRVRDGVKGETSYVTLNLLENKFNGTSTTIKYPAICAGTFVFNGNELTFANSCMWTAEFDWTLILEGKFKATRSGDELTLAKEIDAQNGDYYVLKRQ